MVKGCERQLWVLAAVFGGVKAGSAVVVGVRVAGLEVLTAMIGGGKVGSEVVVGRCAPGLPA